MTNSTRVFTVTKIGCAASTVHVTSFLFEIAEGDTVDLIGKSGDGIERAVRGLRYDVPPGSCAGYYPECNRCYRSGIMPSAAMFRPRNRFQSIYAKSVGIRRTRVRLARLLTNNINILSWPVTAV